MRILTWNVNGIRSLPQYHPWNKLKDWEAILDSLDADVICFQELKISRPLIPPTLALPGKFHTFITLPKSKNQRGYSGVGAFTNSARVIPLCAEEGLSGTLTHPPGERRVYPTLDDDDDQDATITPEELDAEGRTMTLDFGLFVLITTYSPNAPSTTSDDDVMPSRTDFKLAYNALLTKRIRSLLQAGREVILLGDINVTSTPLDHADGSLPSFAANFYEEQPARVWFRDVMLGELGLVDVVRRFHPGEKGLFTCWDTKTGGRESNYGARIDYILVSKGLVPWVKSAGISREVGGSDHCPVWVDLHERIDGDDTNSSSAGRVLATELHTVVPPRDPPRLATKYWDEFSGKQKRLDQFFGSGAKVHNISVTQAPSPPTISSPSAASTPSATEANPLKRKDISVELEPTNIPNTTTSPRLSAPSPDAPSTVAPVASSSKLSTPAPTTKRLKLTPSTSKVSSTSKTSKASSSSSSAPVKGKKGKGKATDSGQTSIGAFFAQGGAKSTTNSSTSGKGKGKQKQKQDTPATDLINVDDEDDDGDYQLALRLSQESSTSIDEDNTPTPSASLASQKTEWANILTPPPPPVCIVHKEPAKQFTVNKAGVNKGRVFYVCARPVGPGYDKGKSVRPRDEVGWQYKCDYFKWASDLKRGG